MANKKEESFEYIEKLNKVFEIEHMHYIYDAKTYDKTQYSRKLTLSNSLISDTVILKLESDHIAKDIKQLIFYELGKEDLNKFIDELIKLKNLIDIKNG